MASLTTRIQDGLDEARTLVLGCQILLAVQYEAPFQTVFGGLPPSSRYLTLCALLMLTVAFGAMVAPVPYRSLVAAGEDTVALNSLVSRSVGVALLPLAAALGMDMFIVGARALTTALAAACAGAAVLLALVLWYGCEAYARARRRPRPRHQDERIMDATTRLSNKIRHVLTEAKVVLPGAQALLGSQLLTVLLEEFKKLPRSSQYVHLASLSLVIVTVILLMAPAAYHRIVEQGEETERFHRIASNFVLASLACLALAMSADLFVVARRVLEGTAASIACAAGALMFFYVLWFGFTLAKRHVQRASVSAPPERQSGRRGGPPARAAPRVGHP